VARVGLLAAFAATAAPVWAEPPRADQLFGRGKQSIGLATGCGWGHELSGSERDALDVQTLPFFPRWAIGVTDVVGDGAWYRGALDFAVEGVFHANRQPMDGAAAGGALALRWNFLPWERLVPYFSASLGALYLDYDLRTQRDGFNFVLYGDVGVQVLVTDRLAVSGGYRLQHISNASTGHPNLGVDTSFALIGVAYFLP
jgi:hypothetical protein